MNQTNYPMFDKLRFLYNLLIIYMTLIFLSSFLLKFQFCTCFSYIFLFTLPLIFYKKNFDYPEKPLKYKHIRRISD